MSTVVGSPQPLPLLTAPLSPSGPGGPLPAGVVITDPVWTTAGVVSGPIPTGTRTSNVVTQTTVTNAPTPNYAAGQCALFTDTYWFVNTMTLTSSTNSSLIVASLSLTNITVSNGTVIGTNVTNITGIPCPRPTVANSVTLNATQSFSWTLSPGSPVAGNVSGTQRIFWPVNVVATTSGTNLSTAVAGSCNVTGVASRTLSLTDMQATSAGGACSNLTCNGTLMNGTNRVVLTGSAMAVCTYTCDLNVTSVSCTPTFNATQTITSLTSNITRNLLNDTTGCLRLLAPLLVAYASPTAWTNPTLCAAGASINANQTYNISTIWAAPTASDCGSFSAGNYTLVNEVRLNTITPNATFVGPERANITLPCPDASFKGDGSYVITQNWTWCGRG